MPPNPGLALPAMHHGIAAMLRLYLQGGPCWQVVEKSSPFNLRGHDVAIHLVVEIGVTAKQRRAGVHRNSLSTCRTIDTLSINLLSTSRSCEYRQPRTEVRASNLVLAFREARYLSCLK